MAANRGIAETPYFIWAYFIWAAAFSQATPLNTPYGLMTLLGESIRFDQRLRFNQYSSYARQL
jgi:hypothetical protein